MYFNILGYVLRDIRRIKNITPDYITEMVDLKKSQLWNIENGFSRTTLNTLLKFSNALNVDLFYLLFIVDHGIVPKNYYKMSRKLTRRVNKVNVKEFGLRFCTYRTKHNIKSTYIDKKYDRGVGALYQIEKPNKNPKISTLLELAKILEMTAVELFLLLFLDEEFYDDYIRFMGSSCYFRSEITERDKEEELHVNID